MVAECEIVVAFGLVWSRNASFSSLLDWWGRGMRDSRRFCMAMAAILVTVKVFLGF